MSAESTEALERSVLESKDREQLLIIASALGVKAASRAKKADIIDKIIQQTSGGDAPAPAPAAPATSAPVAAATRGRSNGNGTASVAVDAPTVHDGADGDDRADLAVSEVEIDEPPAEWELIDGGDADDAPGGDASAQGSSSDRRPYESRPYEARQDNRPSSGQPGQPGQAFPAEGEGAGSSRRRRRRNRDRSRTDTPQANDRVEAAVARQDRQDRPSMSTPMPTSTTADESFVGEPVSVSGYLDLRDEGYGFLRVNGYLPSREDVYVSVKQSRQYGLRKGD